MFGFFKKDIIDLDQEVVFSNWLKENNYYEDFIANSNLIDLSMETKPEYYFFHLDWFGIEKNNKKDLKTWNKALTKWLDFIKMKNRNLISSGFEKKED